jgi:hypothetical protein
MARFVTERDFQFFQHINKEIMIDVVDVPVVLYKVIPDIVAVNIYGESTNKTRYRGIQLHALIKYPKTDAASEGFGFDMNQQNVEFRFQRKLLQDVEVYPDIGDIVGYNDNFYEIDNINEVQLIAGKPQFNQSLVCLAHLTRKSSLNIEETHV